MAEPDRELVAALAAEAGEIGLVLHLGAGDAPEVEAWRAAGAHHIALVEANPVLARTLRQRFGSRANVSVHDCAVAGTDGMAALQVYNLMGLSALRPPADLAALFPGLRRVAAAEVATMRPSRLLETLPPAGAAPDVLIVDIPGEEAAALAELIEAGALRRFHHILLRCGTTEHYLGSSPAAELCAELEGSGYRLTRTDAADPDRPWFAFHLDPLRLEVETLRQTLADERTELEAAVAQFQAERDTMAAHAADLGAARDAMAAERDRISQERDARDATIAQLQAERDTMAARIAELEAEHANTAAERDRISQERDACDATIAQLQAERDTMAAHAADLGAARDTMAAERDRISQSLSEAQAAHAEQVELLRGDAALAVRLQAMREADLRDLQRRHARLTAEKEQQDTLLHKLTERLTLAAQYLQELELSAPDHLAPERLAPERLASERLAPERSNPADTALAAPGEDVAQDAPRKKRKKGSAKARGKSGRKSAR